MRIKATALIIAFACIAACSRKETASYPEKKNGPSNEIEAGVAMQKFVSRISRYAKTLKPGFNIIPQNGSVLAYTNLNPKQGKNYEYIASVDGFGVEELFYDESGEIDSGRVGLLDMLKKDRRILVSEYIPDASKINSIARMNLEAGFVPFIRMKSNYSYQHIPERIRNENASDVTDMDKVQNYLYLINPKEYDSKEALIGAISQTNFDLLIVDLFYEDIALTRSDVEKLKVKANGGKRLVICYMNIGSAEDWRYYWQKDWKIGSPKWIRKAYEGYKGEYYVEFWNPEWQSVIIGGKESYLMRIIDAGFDGTYLDNTEAYHYLYH